jgi:hypothetical protein
MSEDFFITDFKNWNYNGMINKTCIDQYNNNKKLDPFSYNLLKYNCVIMLKEILKHTKDSPERGRIHQRTGVHLYTHTHTHTHTHVCVCVCVCVCIYITHSRELILENSFYIM